VHGNRLILDIFSNQCAGSWHNDNWLLNLLHGRTAFDDCVRKLDCESVMASGNLWVDDLTAAGTIVGALSSSIDANSVGVYNVIYYGADPSGGSSSVTAIQNANNAAAAATGGGIVYFPAGTYKVDLNINPSSNTYWYGRGATLASYAGSSHNLLSNSSAISNFTIDGLIFDLRSNAASAINLPAAGSSDITIVGATFLNGSSISAAAINIGTGNNSSFTAGHCTRVRITDCTFNGVQCTTSYDIVDLYSCDDSIVSRCVFSGCTCNYALAMLVYCNGVIVSDCFFTGNTSELLIFGGQNILVSGCYLNGTANHAGSVIANVSTVSVVGNIFCGTATSSACLQYDVNTNIEGYNVQFSNSALILFEGNQFITYNNGIYIAYHTGTGYNNSPTSIIVRNNLFNGVTTPISYANASSSSIVLEGNWNFNPVGYQSNSSLTGTVTNPYPFTCQATVSGGGGVTNITLYMNGTSHATGLTSGTFILPVGAQISASYSSAPTITWFGL
jgi:Pectate lyase superfamily protein